MCHYVDMVCVHCGGYTRVVNSRPQKRSNQIWRRRQCLACKAVFTSQEIVEYSSAWSVRTNKALEAFSRDKLFLSLLESCGHRQTAMSDAGELTQTAINKLGPYMQSGPVAKGVIVQVSQVVLNRFDKVASIYYSARHKVQS